MISARIFLMMASAKAKQLALIHRAAQHFLIKDKTVLVRIHHEKSKWASSNLPGVPRRRRQRLQLTKSS